MTQRRPVGNGAVEEQVTSSAARKPPDQIRVLVVDDSALVRETVRRGLAKEDGWSVTVAADPVIALQKVRAVPPDVVLLDLEMPRMDGVVFLRHLMAVHPVPVVVLSSHTHPGSAMEETVRRLGAVDVIPKPDLGLKDFLSGPSSRVLQALRRAAESGQPRNTPWPGEVPSIGGGLDGNPLSDSELEPIVLLGASMGGPTALRRVLAAFPSDGPPTLVVQHMMEGYAESFVRRLDAEVAMEVRRAEPGVLVERGRVLVAPGGHHLALEGSRRRPRICLRDQPAVHNHRPSIDVLFESASEILGDRAIAALLTGIGEDGAEGLLALRRAGAATLVQDEATSIAFGMPAAAIGRGAALSVLPLKEIGPTLLRLARGEGKSAVPREPRTGGPAENATPSDRELERTVSDAGREG